MTDLIGIPWKRDGRTNEGLDCVGATILRSAELGNPIPDPGEVLRQNVLNGWKSVQQHIPSDWTQIPTQSEFRLGDVLVLDDVEAGFGGHLVIVDVPGMVLSATRQCGVIRQLLRDVRPLVREAWRPPKQPQGATC